MEPTESPVVAPKNKFPVLVIALILVVLLQSTALAYLIATREKPKATAKQSKIIPTITSNPSASPTAATSAITPTAGPKVALKPGWQRVIVANWSFAMQIPGDWQSGYCRNQQKIAATTLDYQKNDIFFISRDKASYDKVDCAQVMFSFANTHQIYLDSRKNTDDYNQQLTTREGERLPKVLETFVVNGVEQKIMHYNWCEGLQEDEPNAGCLPIMGAPDSTLYILPPSNSPLGDQQYIAISRDIEKDVRETIEFF